MTFGQVFKDARKKAEKTLRETAEHIGMSIGNISDIEHSRRRPPREEILRAFEKFYKVPKDHLVRAAKVNGRSQLKRCPSILSGPNSPCLSFGHHHYLVIMTSKNSLKSSAQSQGGEHKEWLISLA